MRQLAALLFLLAIFNLGVLADKAEGEGMAIEDGKKVSFDYTLTVDGEAVDSSQGRGPLEYTHGEGAIIPGLSKELAGMSVGEEKTIIVSPEEAYGMRDPNALKEIPRSTIAEGVNLEVDALLQVQSTDGRFFTVRVAELKEESVIIDFNHPLAGKTLNFEVKIVSVE